MDPLKVLTMYRQMQPCPLRSTIKKLKMNQNLDKKKEPKPQDDKNMDENKFEYISQFIQEHRSDSLLTDKEINIKITTILMNKAEEQI
jgi:hypothetical protein